MTLVPSCKLTPGSLEAIRSTVNLSEVMLHTCSKEEARELHTMTVYECENVTKTHCTTLWDIDENGEKVWAGNDGDCKDVTWEECHPVPKEVPVLVPYMNCTEYPVNFVDVVNATTELPTSKFDCEVRPIQECKSKTSTKCGSVTYQKCSEVPELVCDPVTIIVPKQEQLHKKWCQFDQAENIDFNLEVKKILEKVEEE